MFAHVPVVLSSPLKLGQISDVVAKIYFEAGEGASAAAAAGAATAPQPAAADAGLAALGGSFCIPWEANLND